MRNTIMNHYNQESLHRVALDIKSIFETFEVGEFLNSTTDDTWEKLELNVRIKQIIINIGHYLIICISV